MTGLPAAIAAAKSPPEALPKANGKLLGPKTTTGPMLCSMERMLALLSMTGLVHEAVKAASAAWRSWLTVRGISTSAKRGDVGKPVSRLAISTSDAAVGFDIVRKSVEKGGDGGAWGLLQLLPRAALAALKAASQSCQLDTG